MRAALRLPAEEGLVRDDSNAGKESIVVLMADDDTDDCLLVKEAFQHNGFGVELRFVADGEELMEYLHRTGRYAESGSAARPDLILLDLNMPRKGGLDSLREIRSDAALSAIPVVVLTTSEEREDILNAYRLGANSFIVKPVTFDQLTKVVKTLELYWFRTVHLPEQV